MSQKAHRAPSAPLIIGAQKGKEKVLCSVQVEDEIDYLYELIEADSLSLRTEEIIIDRIADLSTEKLKNKEHST